MFDCKTLIVLAKSDDEKKKLQDYIQQKRQQQEDIFTNDKHFKDEQEKGRKDKLKKLNEPMKDTSHPVIKRTSAFTPVRWISFFLVDFNFF
jgi:hypothetical protein